MNNDCKKIEIIIFLITLFYAGYYLGPQLGNSTAKYNAIHSVVEDGLNVPLFSINKFILDPYAGINTDDWSFYNGNFYSNKAPGTILLGIPVYFVIANIQKLFGLDLNFPPIAYLNIYLINVFISVLPLAFASVCFYRLMSCFTKKNLELTLLLIFCTPLVPYSTSLWGHCTSCSFLIIGAYFLIKSKYKKDYFYSGLFLAFACSVDYFAILAVVTILIFGILKKTSSITSLILGGSVPIFLTLWYHYVCFGNIFATSTTYTNETFLDKNLFLGMFGVPNFEVLGILLMHPTKGVLSIVPIFILSFFALAVKKNKAILFLCLTCYFVSFSYFLWNSSFNGWHAGATVFFRYLIITSPFMVILLTPLINIKNIILKLLTLLLAMLSALNIFVITSVSTIPHFNSSNPLYGLLYPLFFKGELSYVKSYIRNAWVNPEEYKEYLHISSWNIGQLLGLDGLYSLIPLLLVIVTLLVLLNFYYKRIEN